MIIPFGFTNKDITEDDLRTAQKHLLEGKLNEADVKNIDSLLSYLAVNIFPENK